MYLMQHTLNCATLFTSTTLAQQEPDAFRFPGVILVQMEGRGMEGGMLEPEFLDEHDYSS